MLAQVNCKVYLPGCSTQLWTSDSELSMNTPTPWIIQQPPKEIAESIQKFFIYIADFIQISQLCTNEEISQLYDFQNCVVKFLREEPPVSTQLPSSWLEASELSSLKCSGALTVFKEGCKLPAENKVHVVTL